ncbi:hypothetical protein B296_00034027 [Ensete ventricosum]|uniref:Uncharacterized protein n=1 Tax=Ensete ventricosum TaxID=4639 RepID=A0A427A9H0_ENSVE|nr:hypothetical protein B296_00034027 [Ensete ventricosum]
MRRSLGDVAKASSFPRRLRQGEGDEEKTVAKKSPPHEVLLIHGAVPRFSGHRRLPLLLPLSCHSQATSRLISPGSRRRRSKSTVTNLFWAVTGQISSLSSYTGVRQGYRPLRMPVCWRTGTM